MALAELETEAHIYLAHPADLSSAKNLPAFERLLSPPERERYVAFRHPTPKRLFLTGRALARTMLSRYADVPPQAWAFQTNRHGKPEICGPSSVPSLRINLAHTDELVACLITLGKDCGVDVEDTRRKLDPIRMAEHSFDPQETSDLRSFSGQDLQERFLWYWTLKEAYLKARGVGFALRLDAAVFSFEQPLLMPRFAERAKDRVDTWQFALYRAEPHHLLALAIKSREETSLEPLQIVIYRTEPTARAPEIEVRTATLEKIADFPG